MDDLKIELKEFLQEFHRREDVLKPGDAAEFQMLFEFKLLRFIQGIRVRELLNAAEIMEGFINQTDELQYFIDQSAREQRLIN